MAEMQIIMRNAIFVGRFFLALKPYAAPNEVTLYGLNVAIGSLGDDVVVFHPRNPSSQ